MATCWDRTVGRGLLRLYSQTGTEWEPKPQIKWPKNSPLSLILEKKEQDLRDAVLVVPSRVVCLDMPSTFGDDPSSNIQAMNSS